MSRNVDRVVVERILEGRPCPANPDERAEVLDRWTGTWDALEHITGWNVRRMLRERRSAA